MGYSCQGHLSGIQNKVVWEFGQVKHSLRAYYVQGAVQDPRRDLARHYWKKWGVFTRWVKDLVETWQPSKKLEVFQAEEGFNLFSEAPGCRVWSSGSNSERLLLTTRKMNYLTELSSNTEVMSCLSPNIFKRKAWDAVEGFTCQRANKQLPWFLPNRRLSHEIHSLYGFLVIESMTISTFMCCLNNILSTVEIKIVSSIQWCITY